MRRVYKYELSTTDEQFVPMPDGALILHFDAQHGRFCLWALVDPDEDTITPRRIRVAGTGHDIETDTSKLRHLGTALTGNGMFVWHAFEVLP